MPSVNKYRIVAANAGLHAGQHVLEIGTGWGGFALYAAGALGCRVTTITISREQFELAGSRVRAAGLEHLIDVQLCDYRDIEGTYDAIVSIEMLEAVGAEYLGTFFETCDRALRPGGRLSVQVITFPDAAYERQLRGANWIQTYIFPGGLCPSLAMIERATRQTAFLVTGVTDIAADYVRTLRRVARGVPRSSSTKSGRSASMSGSSGCGSTTSPSVRPVSRPVSARTCRS